MMRHGIVRLLVPTLLAGLAGAQGQEALLQASGGSASGSFGRAVSIRGDYAAVGVPDHDGAGVDAGAVYLYHRLNGVWVEEALFFSPDPDPGDLFGAAVDVARVDCRPTVLVGAPCDDEAGSDAGAFYVLKRESGLWSHGLKRTAPDAASRDHFGAALSGGSYYSGVGAPGRNSAGPDAGAVYIYKQGCSYVYQSVIQSDDVAAGDEFGSALTISEYGAIDWLVVGAPSADGGAGAGYIFDWTGFTFTQVDELTPAGLVAGDRYGSAVGIDRGVAALGAPGADGGGGAVWCYHYDPTTAGSPSQYGTWYLEGPQRASDGLAGDGFGTVLDVHDRNLAVGAPGVDQLGADTGRAYLFKRETAAGLSATWVEDWRLNAADGLRGDGYGGALSLDGDRVLLGASGHDGQGADAGAAYVWSLGADADSQLFSVRGSSAERLGTTLTEFGDQNLDGVPDFVATAPGGQYARIFSGVDGASLLTVGAPGSSISYDSALADAGDLDADGRPDLIVGSGYHFGEVQVLSGLDGSPIHSASGSGTAYLGWSVANAGDVNADGTPDFIAGTGADGWWDEGGDTARLYSGRDGSLLWEQNFYNPWDFPDGYGWSVDGVGDVDGDGHADFAVSEPLSGGSSGLGRVMVYSGATKAQLYQVKGTGNYDALGFTLAGVGDVNGDGSPDLAATTLGAGYARVYSGPDGALLHELGDLGHRGVLDGAGDVDGDGYADVMVSSHESWLVRVHSGLDARLLYDLNGEGQLVSFGHAIRGAPDMDGDGRPDLLVGAPEDYKGGASAGKVLVYSGWRGPALHSTTPTTAGWPGTSTLRGEFFTPATVFAVDGHGPSVLDRGPTAIDFQLAPADPGFATIDAGNVHGLTSASDFELWPSLQAESTGVGGKLYLELDAGDAGLYVLLYGIQSLPAPLPLLPPTHYGLLVDLTGPSGIGPLGALVLPGAAQLEYPVPNNPNLQGKSLVLQGWVQLGASPGVFSFSDLATVVF